MKLANLAVRDAAKKKNVPLWLLASELHISEPTMTRRLRRELPEAERERLLGIIDEISHRKGV